MKQKDNSGVILGLAAFVLVIALLFARVVFPEKLWLTGGAAVPLVVVVALLIRRNQQALRSRSAAYGLNSAVTVLLVLGLLCVGNFMASKYPKKLDLTRNKVNTLSDQTVKVIKALKEPLKATLYAKSSQKEQSHLLLDNYKALNPKFDVEYVDPDREPVRTKAAGVKKYGTLTIQYNGRDSKVEDLSEEKVTNAIIKLSKDRSPTLCTLVGHGERSFSSADAEGYEGIKKALQNQSDEVKDLNLAQEQNKVPAYCDAIAIVGATKSFFPNEIAAISEYLDNGGRAIIALDTNIKGVAYAPELLPLLASWNLKFQNAMVVDPVSRMFNVDASMPIIANFSKTQSITRDFGANTPGFFPMARPIDITQTPPGMTIEAIGKTTPQSFAISDFKALASGEVKVNPALAVRGPFNVAIAIDGKQPEHRQDGDATKRNDSKATKKTRLVVFGSALFATNNFSRYGINQDFFLNAVSWVLEDESMISIRSKQDGPGKVDLSQRTGSVIFLLTVVLVPLTIAAAGVGIWVFRRRL